ncbi:MAG: alpha/beta hydrolase [Pseudomonadota bacterium]
MAKTSRSKWFLLALVALIIVGALAFFMGPRTPVSTEITFDRSAIGDDVDSYLDKGEGGFDDIREGLGKRVVWAYPLSRARTPLSIVYLHGFSASSAEIQPVMDIVADAVGANLFYTRLTGHGRTGPAMAEASVKSWINDVAEAVAIGDTIGERTILVGTSTGGSLVTWAAAQPELTANLAGIINISPNYGIQAFGSQILTAPWAKQLVRLIQGEIRSFEPANELHAQYWTTEYPSEALLPMAELVRLTNQSAFENMTVPALFIYSEADTVVRPEITARVAARWGADSEVVLIENSDDKDNHVIAGDALSPSTTEDTAQIIIDWISRLPASN